MGRGVDFRMVGWNVYGQALEALALAGLKEFMSDLHRGRLDAFRYELSPPLRALAGTHKATLTLTDDGHGGLPRY